MLRRSALRTTLALLVVACAAQLAAAQELDPVEAMAMPFAELAAERGVTAQALAAELGLPPDTNVTMPTGQLLQANGLSLPELQRAVQRLRARTVEAPHGEPAPDALTEEAEGKDWLRIRIKFALWATFFLAALILLMRTRITPRLRVAMLIAAPLIFGVWLGVEPNAPGTVKDGILLYATAGVVFLPRLIAFVGLLLMSVIGNKIFCGWGCQFGTLQDLVWHLPTKKWRPPFWLTSIFRVGFFGALVTVAFTVGADILEPIDPFRIFRMGAISAVAVALVMLIAGVWIYRPWCNFCCPFGLVSWLGERIALTKPRVNLRTCINCLRCERECPTWAIKGLRRREPLPQDCFACGTCIRVCPVSAIRWHVTPPPDREQAAPTEEAEAP